MRQTGYYIVDEIGRIAYYNGVHWTMCGTQDRYLGHTFDAVSTPITPEKMAAIDEILAMGDDQALPLEIVQRISKILAKHRLLPPSARP